jgi:hypothetical protein
MERVRGLPDQEMGIGCIFLYYFPLQKINGSSSRHRFKNHFGHWQDVVSPRPSLYMGYQLPKIDSSVGRELYPVKYDGWSCGSEDGIFGYGHSHSRLWQVFVILDIHLHCKPIKR